MQVFATVLIVFAALFLLFMFGGGYYMYRFAIVRDPKRQKDYWVEPVKKSDAFTDAEFQMIQTGERLLKESDAETVSRTAHDGVELKARLIRSDDPVGVVLMVHGYRSHPIMDFSCAVEPFLRLGFSLLMIEHRAHGTSGGSRIGFGALERQDVVGWARYLGERFPDLPVVLDGVSMGGATVLMTLTTEGEYPKNIRGIIADCGYTTPGAICRKVLKQWFRLPPFPLYYGAKLWVRWLAKYDLDGVSSVEGVRRLKTMDNPPAVVVAHGEIDDFVPYSMAKEIDAAFAEAGMERVPYWFVSSPTADHGMAFLKDRVRYSAAMDELYRAADIPVRRENWED